MAAHPEEILFVSECAYPPCSRPWWICRCCYRGHTYCSEACSELARREKKRQYNRDHQQGPGREDHAERQRAHRLQQAKLAETVAEDNSRTAVKTRIGPSLSAPLTLA